MKYSNYVIILMTCGLASHALAQVETIHEDASFGHPTSTTGTFFGQSIAIDENVIVVGAKRDHTNGPDWSGAAYIYDIGGNLVHSLIPPDDGVSFQAVEFTYFGRHVGIDSGIVAVGAHDYFTAVTVDNDTEYYRGTVFTYDAETGNLLQKLAPPDLTDLTHVVPNFYTPHALGFGLACNDGYLATIGHVPDASDPGTVRSCVYVFDILTGAHTHTLIPSIDDSENALFSSGYQQLAIWDGLLFVGAQSARPNGAGTMRSGAVYVFDLSTGTELEVLSPFDAFESQQFGFAISCDNGVLAIGAPDSGQNGTKGVYLYDASSRLPIRKIETPSDIFSDFGRTVAVSGSTLYVGQENLDRVFVFDLFDDPGDPDDGMLIGIMEESGTPPRDEDFGFLVTADDTNVVVSSYKANQWVGEVWIFADADGDGLSDDWEINGIPYMDTSGNTQRLALPGANPYIKDLYIEIDYLDGAPMLAQSALDKVVQSFADSPVTNPTNPDGTNNPRGITLHITDDDFDIDDYQPTFGDLSVDNADCFPTNFDLVRDGYFGTSLERNDASSSALLKAKAKAFRYAVVFSETDANTDLGKFLGCSDGAPSDSFVINSGNYLMTTTAAGGGVSSTQDQKDQQSLTFMHEFGHNLGLLHGGSDSINGKPNYPSIMNYALTYKAPYNSHPLVLDFSRENAAGLITLQEFSLNEAVGIGMPAYPDPDLKGDYSGYRMPFSYYDAPSNSMMVDTVRLNGSSVDYGSTTNHGGLGVSERNGDDTEAGVVQDLNYEINQELFPYEIMDPFDDWSSIVLPLRSTWRNNFSYSQSIKEPNSDVYERMISSAPFICWVDLNYDQTLNFFDVNIFNQAFAAEEPIGDWNSDGQWNFYDVSQFIVDYTAGCP